MLGPIPSRSDSEAAHQWEQVTLDWALEKATGTTENS